jgi:hypothetical protein
MDTAMNGFFKENMEKTESIDLRFRHGLLSHKFERNPLKAEKSPRIRNTGFDFSVPTKVPEPQRWVFPDTDRGLVSKLPSQKVVYEELKAKEKAHLENVKYLTAQQAAIFAKQEQQDNKTNNNNDTRTLQEVASKYDDSRQFDKYDDLYNTGANGGNMESSRRSTGTSNTKSKFYKQPISTFKSLGNSNPEILADWRAHRAADYIATLQAPLEPPPFKDLGPTPFRPPGGLARSQRALEGQYINNNGSSKVLMTADSLEQQLHQTQQAIERQKTKVLNMKKKQK